VSSVKMNILVRRVRMTCIGGFGIRPRLPGLEKNQRVMAQRRRTNGIRCTAFSANLTRALPHTIFVADKNEENEGVEGG
jgi:hypothetical protein